MTNEEICKRWGIPGVPEYHICNEGKVIFTAYEQITAEHAYNLFQSSPIRYLNLSRTEGLRYPDLSQEPELLLEFLSKHTKITLTADNDHYTIDVNLNSTPYTVHAESLANVLLAVARI